MALLLHRGYVPREGWKSIGELVLVALKSTSPALSVAPLRSERKRQGKWWRRICSWLVPEACSRKELWARRIHLHDLKGGIVFGDEGAEIGALWASSVGEEVAKGHA